MVTKGRGGGLTPNRVIELLQDEVKRTSQAATARATGLTLQTVQRYIKGIGEPTTATLEKLAKYFKTSVAYLRGEPWATRDGGVRTDIAVPPESKEEFEDTLDKILGVGKPSQKTIQVKIQERVDDLIFMSKSLLMLARLEIFRSDDAERSEYMTFLSDLIHNIKMILPTVDENNEILLKNKIEEIQSVLDKFSKI
jgi:transcriptional regulator with XRE-family HTH domain